jgi:hypothetical protein
MAEPPAPATKLDAADDPVAATLSRIDASWRGWLDALSGFPDDRLAQPGVVGDWSLKDLFGHVAFWDGYTVEASRRLLAGKSPRQIDWEAMNQREVAARAARPAPSLHDEMMRTHDAMRAFVASLGPADLDHPAVAHRLRVDTFEHYDDHAAVVRAWRTREGL